jgi:hypothetical protein
MIEIMRVSKAKKMPDKTGLIKKKSGTAGTYNPQ